MKCELIRDQLIETARGRGLSSDLRAVVFAHAAECDACAKQLDAHRFLTSALTDLATETEFAPARMEQILRREFAVAGSAKVIRFPKRLRVGVSALAVAASVATVAIVLPGLHSGSSSHSVQVASSRAAKQVDVPRPVVVQTAVLNGAPVTQAKQHVKTGAAAQDDADMLYADFTELPYAPELSPTESTDVVRVQLPRESLLAMGIPVSADLAGEVIQADVLLGMDGTARAIRIAN